jgi:hypothetical protein
VCSDDSAIMSSIPRDHTLFPSYKNSLAESYENDKNATENIVKTAESVPIKIPKLFY